MQPLNQLFKNIWSVFFIIFLFTSCGDHSKTAVDDPTTNTPVINLTSGPYVVVAGKELIVGVETKYATKEPVYTAIPVPVGIAIVNSFLPGQMFVTGVKAGTTTFTITDQANPTAVPRTIQVTVNDPPSLKVKPSPLTGRAGQSLLVEVTTLNPETTSEYTLTISNTSVARIQDKVNNPTLIDLIKAGTTTVTIEDKPNGLSEDFELTVTQ